MIDYTDLIRSLEAAAEGGWELDAAIEAAISEWRNLGGGWHVHKVTGVRERYAFSSSPPFTTSLDTALTLLPDFISYELTRSASGKKSLKRARLWDWRRSATMSDPGNEWKSEANTTLPLCVCAAALKVRMSLPDIDQSARQFE